MVGGSVDGMVGDSWIGSADDRIFVCCESSSVVIWEVSCFEIGGYDCVEAG